MKDVYDTALVRPMLRWQSIGVPAETPLLLFVGRVNRLKGLDVLIESVEPLLDAGTVLAVVGRDHGQFE